MIPFVVACIFALAVMGYAIRRVRSVREQLVRNNAQTFKAQVRRAECWERFCVDCKQIAAPWWKP